MDDLAPSQLSGAALVEAVADLASGINVKASQASPFCPHPGDVRWWCWYLERGADPLFSKLRLWLDGKGRSAAWAFVSPEEGYLELFASPGLEDARGALAAALAAELRARGAERLVMTWVAENDGDLALIASSLGLARTGDAYIQMERSLAELPAAKAAPQVRAVALPVDLRARAEAQRLAFGSSRPPEDYLRAYLAFASSPGYARCLDLVLEEGGGIAAFAIAWPDIPSGLSLIEPLGVRPDRQGRGLGKTLLLAVLRRLAAAGQSRVRIMPEAGNAAAIALYRSCGFAPVRRIEAWTGPSSAAAPRV